MQAAKFFRTPNAELTIVIPCLNEAGTLPTLLMAIKDQIASGAFGKRHVQILVSDNGSTDGSQDLARGLGVSLTHCPTRGYGAALRHGIMTAKTPIVMFMDADMTYDPADAPRLVDALDVDVDMVLGDRLGGKKIPGAMPPLHRYLGTPVLTFLINALFARHTRIRDCNSGYRCFWKDAYEKWNITGFGMEFASEMLVRVLQTDSVVKNVPVTLSPSPPGRVPHLRTWRDGMRHLLQILLEAPSVFRTIGMVMILLGWAGLIATLFGPFRLFGGWLFGVHSAVIFMLMVLVGQDVWSIGLFVSLKSGKPVSNQYRWAIDLNEGTLFWAMFSVFAVIVALLIGAVLVWSQKGYVNLALEAEFIAGATLIMQVVEIHAALMATSLIRRLVNYNS